MARGPIKKKPAAKAKGAKPSGLTPGAGAAAKPSWKPPHPMAAPPAVSPVRQQSQKRGKR